MIGYQCNSPVDSSACYSDCQSAYDAGHRENGIYQVCFITSDGVHKGPYSVFCTNDYYFPFGWLVIQRRYDGSVSFERSWDDYKHGFGNLSTEFWLGNELIHELTSLVNYRLRIEMVHENGTTSHSKYQRFRVEDEGSGYRLHVLRYDGGDAGDAFGLHDGYSFSTIDRDNDQLPGNKSSCARLKGAGWYRGLYPDCGHVSFNMRRMENGTIGEWWTNGTMLQLRSFELKIRPVGRD
ncbi:angiopoietin-related protein 1-like [Lytechinus variegatus]|uniref:angiopoietin-related protein 1-like n=1 Tax=Lytechinus variegatus TaxID=7654 RepID=UPI001BB29333|nr:angiopoietin-related protein 1-like [Lytechinus variegatus]